MRLPLKSTLASKGGASTTCVKLLLSLPAPLVAVTVNVELPSVVGVPL
jgi:hypothetical protein